MTRLFPFFQTLLLATLLLGIFVPTSACQKEDDDGSGNEPPCDNTLSPLVLVHGFLASGDTYASQVQRFVANGYCPDRIFVFDWNTTANNQAEAIARLDAFIGDILTRSGASKVMLAGHSAGGGLGYNYLSDAGRAAKVEKYAHLGSGAQAKPAGPNGEIPTLNIWSAGDKVVPGADIPGAENMQLITADHYQVATGTDTFTKMYEFFRGKAAERSTPAATDQPELAGRVLTLGENKPLSGATVEIYALEPSGGSRQPAAPAVVFTTDAEGRWGPWTGKADTYYEFFVRSADPADRPIHYFREPFPASDRLIYLRTFPAPTTLAGLLLAGVPRDDDQSVVAVFSANQAVITGRDALDVDGFNLATADYAAAERTAIAFFLYDDGDGQSSGNKHAAFNFLPAFLTGVDYFIPTSSPGSVQLTFKGRKMAVPNFKSATDGVIVAVFD